MKNICFILCLSFIFIGCQLKIDNSANETFEKNSQTVLANITGFQNENVDYSQYAKDFVMRDTGFGSKDSLSLDDIMKNDKWLWENFDFKILNDPIVLLPGVDADTKLADGSVRYYSNWEITRTATDSAEAKSGILKMYESFDFDKDGKIIYQQTFGDFTGLMMHLQNKE